MYIFYEMSLDKKHFGYYMYFITVGDNWRGKTNHLCVFGYNTDIFNIIVLSLYIQNLRRLDGFLQSD